MHWIFRLLGANLNYFNVRLNLVRFRECLMEQLFEGNNFLEIVGLLVSVKYRENAFASGALRAKVNTWC